MLKTIVLLNIFMVPDLVILKPDDISENLYHDIKMTRLTLWHKLSQYLHYINVLYFNVYNS